MRVLVACEYSGRVRDAFIARGHDAISCDLLPTEAPGPHHQGDVCELLGEPWDIVIAHPPCFVAGTLVLTKRGHIPIEEVVVGDFVLTHLGRWRRVTETMHKSTDDLLALKATNALPIMTTPEHPFYARYRAPYAHGFRTLEARDGPAEFVQAGSLSTRHFTGSVLPPVTQADISDDDLWLMGRYVADGHMRRSRWTDGKWEEMNLAVGSHELEEFKRDCPRKCRISWNGTAHRATFYGHDTIKDFAQFGFHAHKKALPVWVMELPARQAKAFLQGYLSGDGYIRERDTSAATVSPRLALGIAVLMQRVYGKCPRLGVATRKPTVEIQGRTVRQRSSISVSVGNSNDRLRNYVDGDYAWGHVRAVARKRQRAVVFNLSVEDDETYTANGVVVHNCTRLCNSGVRWLAERDLWGEMRENADFFLACLNANTPRVAVENPVMHGYAREIIGRGPDFTVQPWQFGDPAKKRTCFWTRGLPPLKPTSAMTAADARAECHMASPGPDRWRERSRTYPGLARAIADQWGAILASEAA